MALPYMHSTITLYLKMAIRCTRCTVKLHCNFSAIALKLHYTRNTTRARFHSHHFNYAQCTHYNGRATQGYDFWWLLTRSKARSLTLHLCFNAREPHYNERAHNEIAIAPVLFSRSQSGIPNQKPLANSISVARRITRKLMLAFCKS